MTLTFDDDTLLAALSEALAPEPVEPGVPRLAALHRALRGGWPRRGHDDVLLAPIIPMDAPQRPNGRHLGPASTACATRWPPPWPWACSPPAVWPRPAWPPTTPRSHP